MDETKARTREPVGAFLSSMRIPMVVVVLVCAMLLAMVPRAQAFILDDDATNAAANMGERLFLETRFAEYFFTNSWGDANAALNPGDPVLNELQTYRGPQPGPFAGLSMNCRNCHLVNEMQNSLRRNSLGNRTYCDFAPRSPVPNIGDGSVQTPRNAPGLVNALVPRGVPLLLHYDGQFTTPQELIIATLTGRNYGWNPTESDTAIHHIANIIRYDNGQGELAQSQYGGGYPYSLMFQFPPGGISTLYRLDDQYWLGDLKDTNTDDPQYVSDETIVQTVAALIEQYLDTLVFSQDTNGNFNGSPYDVFLSKNGLPQQPDDGETPLQYSQRLLQLIEQLPNPQYVSDPADGHFETQNQTFQFGPLELEGLTIFFETNVAPTVRMGGRTGNCVVCHAPPDFTDFIFHNTGAAQEEYDAIYGQGAFKRLVVPNLAQRQANYNACLPPTANHPNATGKFRTPPARGKPGVVDLGLWNVLDNPDYPRPQAGLQEILAGNSGITGSPDNVLQSSIARFKTPTLRDLGQSAPYLHTGRMNTLEAVIEFDMVFSEKARQGNVRNADPELQRESVDGSAVEPLAAFLRALNEDYTD